MSTIKLKVTIAPKEVEVDKAEYQEEWEEKCREDGLDESEDDFPPIPDEFVIDRFTEEMQDGTRSLDDTLPEASVEVEQVE